MIGRVEETTASFEARVRASTLPDCGGARGNSRPYRDRREFITFLGGGDRVVPRGPRAAADDAGELRIAARWFANQFVFDYARLLALGPRAKSFAVTGGEND